MPTDPRLQISCRSHPSRAVLLISTRDESDHTYVKRPPQTELQTYVRILSFNSISLFHHILSSCLSCLLIVALAQTAAMRRPILITGSTGKQGRALIRALLHGLPPIMPSAEDEYRIYALTRSSSSAAAKALRESENEERLQIVEGDLDDRESIVRIFERVSGEEGGFWGVYCVLEFPGLGADATGEERRGKVGFCFSFFLLSCLLPLLQFWEWGISGSIFHVKLEC